MSAPGLTPAHDDASRFETIFAQAPFSMQLLAVDGRTLRVNRAWERLWQVEGDEALKAWVLGGGYNVLEDPQLEAKGVTPLLRRAFAGEPVEIPPVLYDPAEMGRPGRARWVKAGAHPILDAAGRVREVMLIHEDVTSRFESELALKDSEQRLRLATDAAKIGIWDWDIERDAVTWTPEVYALHGLAPGTFGGTSRAFAARIHPDDAALVWERIEQAVASETGFNAEFRVVLPEGGDRWLSTSSRVYRGVDGGRRMVGATFSIDPYKKAEGALRDGDRRKDEFLAMLAHELRNPLAPIRSAAEVLLMAPQDEWRMRKASEVIARQVAHVTKLVDDLLDVSRVTRGLVALDKEPLEIEGAVRNAIEQALPLFEARGHALRTKLEAGGACVVGDRARLVQAIVNLLANAARYTPAGGRIEVSVSRDAGEALVRVTDNGQGIAPALLPHVFELFTQGPRALDRSQGGLGIGLALVRRLVELHGGTVHAASEGPGRGSTFTIRLPAAEAVPAAQEPGPCADRIARTRGALEIMVVDDNRDAGETIAMLLRLAGHRVHVLHDAAGALAFPSIDAIDVFMLDIGLPDMDGVELGRRLREANAKAVCMAMSGYGQASDVERSRAAGFAHHLVKPVAWETLAALLGEVRPAAAAAP